MGSKDGDVYVCIGNFAEYRLFYRALLQKRPMIFAEYRLFYRALLQKRPVISGDM